MKTAWIKKTGSLFPDSDPNAPTSAPSGTVTFEGGQAA
jgi:hypothetical protein